MNDFLPAYVKLHCVDERGWPHDLSYQFGNIPINFLSNPSGSAQMHFHARIFWPSVTKQRSQTWLPLHLSWGAFLNQAELIIAFEDATFLTPPSSRPESFLSRPEGATVVSEACRSLMIGRCVASGHLQRANHVQTIYDLPARCGYHKSSVCRDGLFPGEGHKAWGRSREPDLRTLPATAPSDGINNALRSRLRQNPLTGFLCAKKPAKKSAKTSAF